MSLSRLAVANRRPLSSLDFSNARCGPTLRPHHCRADHSPSSFRRSRPSDLTYAVVDAAAPSAELPPSTSTCTTTHHIRHSPLLLLASSSPPRSFEATSNMLEPHSVDCHSLRLPRRRRRPRPWSAMIVAAVVQSRLTRCCLGRTFAPFSTVRTYVHSFLSSNQLLSFAPPRRTFYNDDLERNHEFQHPHYNTNNP